MHNKKSHLGKKGGIMKISAIAVAFSFLSIVFIFIALFNYAVANDFLFYELQNITETLQEDGIVSVGTAELTQTFADDFRTFNFNTDNLWLVSYIIFVSSSLVMAYRTKVEGYFTSFGYLFYIMMFVLFVLTLFSTLTNWFNDQILEAVFPAAVIMVPMFYFYLNHLGTFTAVHLVVCVLVSLVDFDFTKFHGRKKQEKQALEDNEAL